ncbi:hypothetical protein, partial [Oceanobacillus massiliensis]|uniref:hypothetical protein n=1 Tax=Oceanobacillus massiliensis TaxID=1465765 RepID=UPI0030168024
AGKAFFYLKKKCRVMYVLVAHLCTSILHYTFYQELDIFVEANAILSNLNIAIERGSSIDLNVILMNLFNVFPLIFRYFNFFSDDVVSTFDFAEVVSKEFHPSVDIGMGRSFWAEIYTYGGPIILGFSIIGWIFLIVLGSRLIIKSSLIGIFLLPAFVNTTFYIHRLDLANVTSSFKTNLTIFAIVYTIYLILIKPYLKKRIFIKNSV